MRQTGIFAGRTQVVYPYGRYGWTRGGGKIWHGGLDLVGLDDTTVRIPIIRVSALPAAWCGRAL